jgi:hypothetical protein
MRRTGLIAAAKNARRPGGTGVELWQKIHERQPKAPVLYYSAYTNAATCACPSRG